jgi:hypothetical protein
MSAADLSGNTKDRPPSRPPRKDGQGRRDRDTAVAVGHDRQFGLLVPMKFADAAGGEAHIDAGDLGRDGEVRNGDMASPATVLDAPRCEVKRGLELRQAAYIGRWVQECRHGAGQTGIMRPGMVSALRVGDIDRGPLAAGPDCRTWRRAPALRSWQLHRPPLRPARRAVTDS